MALALLALGITGCVDMSMYNQTPAPVGQPGQSSVPQQESPTEVQTWPLESSEPQEVIPSDNYVYEEQEMKDQPATNPAVVALLESAEENRRAGRYAQAASGLERAIRISPRDPLLWNRLAQVRLDQSKPGLAESMAKKSNLLAEGNRPLQYSNWLLIAEARQRLGDSAGAEEARRKADQL